ncbi:MAG: FliM/FliN family flagellar motor switch protein [Planctomycetaceae bacterium]
MSEFKPEHLEAVPATCAENLAALAESFSQCFDLKRTFLAGEPADWSPERDGAEFAGAGVLVALNIGGQGLVVLVPAAAPLPEWIAAPGKSENARLQTLAMEWGMNILPSDLEAESSSTRYVANLWEELQRTEPAANARLLEWTLVDAEAPAVEETEPAAEKPSAPKLLVVWPVAQPEATAPASEESAAEASPAEAAAARNPSADPDVPFESLGGRPISPIDEFRQRTRRLFNLPVSVSVRLAEKKIPMGQLLSITPGALITFNKPCEDLLDLYINNSRYCRGEAVKIGEKFGLKVHEVGVVEVRKEKVI